MSSSGGSKVPVIPSGVRQTIQDIKEITGNHSEEEIYAMLRECSMDPNETAQKLLFQDTFHEVKRKRDRRKESSNRESSESRWQPGSQGRGSKGGRSNYLPRHVSNDAGDGRNAAAAKENGINPAADKGVGPTSHGIKNKESISAASPLAGATNRPNAGSSANITVTDAVSSSRGNRRGHSEMILPSSHGLSKLDNGSTPLDANGCVQTAVGADIPSGQSKPNPSPPSSVCFSSSDPVILPSIDSRIPSSVSTIKREVGSHRPPVEPDALSKNKAATASEVGGSLEHEKMPNQFQEADKTGTVEPSQHSFGSTHGVSSVSRPSSNYNNRSQQLVGSQKVGSNKEWKPKPTNPTASQRSGTVAPEVNPVTTSQLAPSIPDPVEAASTLQKKLETLRLSQRQPVILPNHIHVPESERTKFSFGSFDASFGISTNSISAPESDKSSTIVSEMSLAVEETMEDSSGQIVPPTADEENYPDYPQSPRQVPESVSPAEDDVSSSAAPNYKELKQEGALGQQQSAVHTSPNYNFGFGPPVVGNQIASFENSESQTRDAPRLPSFVVQQPFDPAIYPAQFYRSGIDTDGRLSPFSSPGVATKYNDSVGVLQQQASQPSQEGGNSLVLSTAGPTPLVTQTAGLMQNSLAMTQQPLPVFRPPTGVHMAPYSPNYFHYGPYYPQFFVPPPAIPQFLANGTFAQQPQAASLFPAPPTAAASAVKYPLPQYKTAGNTGNPTHVGVPISYGPYGSSAAGYNSGSAATAGNTNTNEELGASQFKENNMYITGQQSEGSRVWIAAPGREIPSLPTTSFYNLPQQAVQDLGGAVDMTGPAANVYQQPQHAQMAWPSNY
ncbi:GBF-interacting protein 1 isoform X2 [Eucalyptus grandis]|uniref:Uncharacterized protein n=2 Tax=Eucalyptus grandis TaxID=71139 RepID=A0ACC3IT59_EUCGR|nr:GBF-interacting protein 1 isoform X2 [Eucalyptus grandis]KAK3405141.1 hypothetical protein EUGRSUZ_K01392 [Eucalyptus grandis]